MSHKTLKDGTKMTKPSCEYHQKSYQAIMNYRDVEPDASAEEYRMVVDAYWKIRDAFGYITYTQLKQVCRLPYPRIFAAVKGLHLEDPYNVSFSVNRMGENTRFKMKNR